MRFLFAISLLLGAFGPAQAQPDRREVVYLRQGGAAFTLDVIRPTRPNRAAVIVLISGSWISNHQMLADYGPKLAQVFTDSGFTVLEVVHGAQPRYTVREIARQVDSAVAYVAAHAAELGVDATRLGLTGISSGGNLALLSAGTPNTPLRAVAAIAPPTDLVNWGKPAVLFTDLRAFATFPPAFGLRAASSRAEATAAQRSVSPVLRASATFPPTLIVHGDGDTVVPLQQGQRMITALTRAGGRHRLEVIPGGGHDEATFLAGLTRACVWFQDVLLR